MLLVIAPALAESHLLDAVPREVGGETNSTNVNSTVVNSTNVNSTAAYTLTIAPPVSLPDNTAPHRVKVIDKKFIAVMGTLGGAESLRFTTHKLVLDNEYAAGAPWVTKIGRAHV